MLRSLMLQRYGLLLGLLLLFQTPFTSHGQNAVRLAARLHQCYARTDSLLANRPRTPTLPTPGSRAAQRLWAERMITACQQFFRLLATNTPLPLQPDREGTQTVRISDIQRFYQPNPLLAREVDSVVSRWKTVLRADVRNKLRLRADSIRAGATEQLAGTLTNAVRRASTLDQARALYTDYGIQPQPGTDTTWTVEAIKNKFLTQARPQLEAQAKAFFAGGLAQALPILSYFARTDTVLWQRVQTDKTRAAATDAAARAEVPVTNPTISFEQQNTLVVPASFALHGVGLPASAGPMAPAGPKPRPSTGSLQADMVVGTADFLADRLKQELNATFFQHFATLLHDTTYVELQLLFPSTARLLTSGTADYGTLVQTLRGTFEHDLRDLLFNYSEMLRTQHFYQAQLQAGTGPGQVLRYAYVATRTVYYLAHGSHPADLIPYLQADIQAALGKPTAGKELPILQALQVTDVLAKAMLSDDTIARAWQQSQEVDPLLKDAQTQRFFTGLVWQRVNQLPFLQIQPNPRLQNPTRFREMLLGFVNLSTELERQVQQLRPAAGPRPALLRGDDFVPLYQTVQKSLQFVTTSILPDDAPTRLFQANLPRLEKISNALMEGYVAADRGDYGVTISNFLEVVLLTLSPAPAPGTGLSGQVVAFSATQAAQTRLRSLPQIVRYGTFMAALAQAKNPDDVRHALEAAALPVGSSSVKRRSFSSISLNAFGGVTGGLEYTSAPSGLAAAVEPATPWRANVGFSAPIGLALSWGWRRSVQRTRLQALVANSARQTKRTRQLDQAYRYYNREGQDSYLTGSAFSLFVSVADLGVPVLLRLQDAQTTTVPRNVDFRHVFAPGLFAVHGFRNTPLSAFVGAQFTPQLRQLDTTGLGPAPAPFLNSLRFNVGVTIDIPIVTLFNRTESRQPTPGRQQVELQARHNYVELTQYRALLHAKLLPTTLKAELDTLLAQVRAYRRQHPELDRAAPALDLQLTDLLDQAKAALDRNDLAQVARLRADIGRRVDEAVARAATVRQTQATQAAQTDRGAKALPPAAPVIQRLEF